MTKKFLIVFLLFILLISCKNRKINLPDLPYLIADSLMHFKVGDRFILATSENSCCQYYWISDNNFYEIVPQKTILKSVDIIIDEADPDCAGCSSYTYQIYECVKPGADSLVFAVIPAGDAEFFEQIHQLSFTDSEKNQNKADINQLYSGLKKNNYLRVFRFVISN